MDEESIDSKGTGPRLLTTPALAKRLGISVRTIQRWRTFGFISPADFVAGRPRWRVAEVKKAVVDATFSGKRRPRIQPRRKLDDEGPR